MKRPTPRDTEEMHRGEFESGQIQEAQSLIQSIRDAFKDVSLGDGVGLYEAQAIDDYETDMARAAARATDEKQDWSKIPKDSLIECNSSLSFFDAEGMRFHLPAFLISEIEGGFSHGLDYHVSEKVLGRGKFSLLSEAQCAAVRDFLDYISDEANASDTGLSGNNQSLE